jgi:lysophospholipase L1-like esterase
MKNALYGLMLVVVSLITALALLEAGLRITGYGKVPRRELDVEFFRFDPLYGWGNNPHAKGQFKMEDSVSEVKINSRGLRLDKDHSYARHGKPRLAIMGDSFTWGYGVDNDERFSDILERDFFRTEVEVFNAGVIGYGTDQELLLYENEITKYQPDVVILALDLTDIYYDNYQTLAYGYPKPHFEKDDKGGVRLNNIAALRNYNPADSKAFATGGLRVIKFLRERLNSSPLITDAYLKYLVYSNKVDLELSERLIKRFEASVKKDGGKFLVFIVPSRGDVRRGRPNYLVQEMVNFLQSNHILHCFPFDRFKEVQKTTNLYFVNDEHFNEAGNRLAAEEIFSTLQKLQILP